MSDVEKKAKTARARAVTAARRSLKLVAEEAAAQLAVLENGGVPDTGFLTSALKYEQSRDRLALLAALGDETAPDDGTGEVQLEDLAVLVQLVRGVLGPDAVPEDSPVARVAAVAFPDGVPGSGASSGRPESSG